MTHEELLTRITIDSGVCHGKPCIRGQRIWVGLVLGMLEDGMREEEILAEYPSLDGPKAPSVPRATSEPPRASWGTESVLVGS